MPTSPTTEATRADHRPARDRIGGFTLVEVALALVVIGMIAALGLPFAIPNRSPAALRSKVFEVVSMLRSSRNEALRSGRAVSVVVDGDARYLRSSVAGWKIALPPGLTIRLASAGGEAFQFFPDGRASGGELWLQSGTTAYSVQVNALTSAVDVAAAHGT